jgi:outer membrane lipase/esterase
MRVDWMTAVNSGALYSVWAGANDVFFQLGLAAAGAATPAQVQANLATAATQLVQQVGQLNAAGARYIIVWNVPDIGKTPFGVGSGQGATITALSSFFNSTLSAGLDLLHVDVIRLNSFALLNEAIADPAAFGLTNVTTPACTTPSSLICTSATDRLLGSRGRRTTTTTTAPCAPDWYPWAASDSVCRR